MANLLSAPYRDRQFITITKSSEAAQAKEQPLFSNKGGIPWVLLGLPVLVVPIAVGIAASFACNKMKEKAASPGNNQPRHVLGIDGQEAEQLLKFPAGHPLYNTVYAGHPLLPPVYMPVASFHVLLFQEKITELMNLLSCLGAAEVDIRCNRGYAELFAAGGGLAPPIAELSLGGGRERSNYANATLRARFMPSGEPRLPDMLTWYHQEPTWASVVEGRMRRGLTSIDVVLHYDDDFGVSSNLAVEFGRYGLRLGGDFYKHEQAAWSFHATFA